MGGHFSAYCKLKYGECLVLTVPHVQEVLRLKLSLELSFES